MHDEGAGPEDKAGWPGAPDFQTNRGESAPLCHLRDLESGARMRCPSRAAILQSSNTQEGKDKGRNLGEPEERSPLTDMEARGSGPRVGGLSWDRCGRVFLPRPEEPSPWAAASSTAGAESSQEVAIKKKKKKKEVAITNVGSCFLKLRKVFMTLYLVSKPGPVGLPIRLVIKSLKTQCLRACYLGQQR